MRVPVQSVGMRMYQLQNVISHDQIRKSLNQN